MKTFKRIEGWEIATWAVLLVCFPRTTLVLTVLAGCVYALAWVGAKYPRKSREKSLPF